MKKSHLKLLTKEELKYFNDTYSFKIIDEGILTTTKNYNRVVVHDIDKDFLINTKIRNVKITSQAMKMWINYFKNTKYTLFDIQNAINALIISYQDIDSEEVMNELKILEKGYLKK